jgi:hypothetical protein
LVLEPLAFVTLSVFPSQGSPAWSQSYKSVSAVMYRTYIGTYSGSIIKLRCQAFTCHLGKKCP